MRCTVCLVNGCGCELPYLSNTTNMLSHLRLNHVDLYDRHVRANIQQPRRQSDPHVLRGPHQQRLFEEDEDAITSMNEAVPPAHNSQLLGSPTKASGSQQHQAIDTREHQGKANEGPVNPQPQPTPTGVQATRRSTILSFVCLYRYITYFKNVYNYRNSNSQTHSTIVTGLCKCI